MITASRRVEGLSNGGPTNIAVFSAQLPLHFDNYFENPAPTLCLEKVIIGAQRKQSSGTVWIVKWAKVTLQVTNYNACWMSHSKWQIQLIIMLVEFQHRGEEGTFRSKSILRLGMLVSRHWPYWKKPTRLPKYEVIKIKIKTPTHKWMSACVCKYSSKFTVRSHVPQMWLWHFPKA